MYTHVYICKCNVSSVYYRKVCIVTQELVHGDNVHNLLLRSIKNEQVVKRSYLSTRFANSFGRFVSITQFYNNASYTFCASTGENGYNEIINKISSSSRIQKRFPKRV